VTSVIRNSSTLYSQLLNTGLQQKDNPLYQVIYSLIKNLVSIEVENTLTTEVISGLVFTPGSVPYAGVDGKLTQDNANFFWDYGNKRLGIGTNGPSYSLHIVGDTNALADTALRVENTNIGATAYSVLDLVAGSSGLRMYVPSQSVTEQAAWIGTTASKPLALATNSVIKWRVLSSGHIVAEIDNTYDIGAAAATRPRTGYFGTSLVSPIIAGGTAAGDFLKVYGTLDVAGNVEPIRFFTNTNTVTGVASIFSNGVLCLAGVSVTPIATSLGSGGTFVSSIHNTASGGFQAASNSIISGTDIGYIDFGTFGTPAGEKRVAGIHGFLTASAAATPTGEMRFYTTLAGTIAEQLAITSAGKLRFNSTRIGVYSPADSQITFEANNASTGFGLQSGTADVMIVANQAQNAYGTVDALQYKISGTIALVAASLTFPSRTKIAASADGFLEISNNAASSGFGIQTGTADTMIVANKAQNAYGDVKCKDLYVEQAVFLIRTGVSWADHSAGSGGTLTNAPAAGNPTRWIAIDDNGTTRYIPAW
jgi:hypothetical protein